MVSQQYIKEMKQRSSSVLIDGKAPTYLKFYKDEMELIRSLHENGVGGFETASNRSNLMDVILTSIFIHKAKEQNKEDTSISLVAVGGYGRGVLNPSSDIDLLFLLPKPSNKLSKCDSAFVESILYILWDLGVKLGHSTRSINESIQESKRDQQNMTALLDARLIIGNEQLTGNLIDKFNKDCADKNHASFIDLRRGDIRSRHRKYSHTVFLQEPHVKESCGGLRDYHNMLWISRVKRGINDLSDLSKERILTKKAVIELKEAHDFLLRVRNALHFHSGKCTDILTLQLQGVVATEFKYPQKSILRRCEFFMRDYYRHTRNMYQRLGSLLEIFEIESEDQGDASWNSFLTKRRKKKERFDLFHSRNGRIFPAHQSVFEDDNTSLMRVFVHCQQRGLKLSPEIRKLIKVNLDQVGDSFRKSKANREAFRAILEKKGDVASSLRRMHRVGFLGAYMPEFGAMDCLVQHEFFHRYTADEHTLRCIEELDALIIDERKERNIYRNLLHKHSDPYALYLALILHDSGRAENVREHIDGSAMLASRVCSRLLIKGARRSRITFLVDHHLTFWRYATNRNLGDPEVIEEFASIMKTQENLDALLLFTYADSNGTNEEAWSPWKESLMLELYRSTSTLLSEGREKYHALLMEERELMKERVKKSLDTLYHEEVDIHFSTMPDKYFQYADSNNITTHVRATRRFKKNDRLKAKDGYIADMRWIDYPERGYTELIITTWNRPYLLEKACCALASQEINIMRADVFTRTDEVVCDIFRVCTIDWKPISKDITREKVFESFTKLFHKEEYDSSAYLTKKTNLLHKDANEGGIPFPVHVYVNNHISDHLTGVEIQAQDRIGLLHDLFQTVDSLGLSTAGARICTEKGAAVNTIYVTQPDGSKVLDQEKILEMEKRFGELVEAR